MIYDIILQIGHLRRFYSCLAAVLDTMIESQHPFMVMTECSLQTNLEAIRKDQNVVLSSVAKALESSRKAALKRPAVPGPKPAHKKTRYSSDSEGSESGADESDEEAQERPSSEASERAQEADEKLSSVKEIGEAKEVMIKQVTSVASENGTTTIAREISLAG